MLQQLAISGIRNLDNCQLRELAAVNVIHGDNGSGKTSVLEAIHVLGVSRSFRSTKMQSVINYQADAALVWGDVGGNGSQHRLGVQRFRRQRPVVKVDGDKVYTLVELARLLPLQLVNADSFKLLEGAPSLRRQLLDWGVFHVKHSDFYLSWQRYTRALKQRNSLLRRGKMDASLLSGWDHELVTTGELLHELRSEQFMALAQSFQRVYRELLDGLGENSASQELSFEYYPGWNTESPFAELLIEGLERDRQSGYTRGGPHRADIRIRLDGVPAAEVLSRGQLKTVVCAIRIAQAMLLQECGIKSVFLIDDLPAELDRQRRELITRKLLDMGLQLFITSITAEELDHCWSDPQVSVKRFHVEHGHIRPE